MILCADDFGLSSNINAAILLLAEQKVVTATSCVVTSSESAKDIRQLKALHDSIDVGLHFVLSHEEGFESFAQLSWRSCLHRLDQHVLREQMRAQLETFCDLFGDYPDFFDGHQHVHQLPQVRDIFIELISQVAVKKKIYARHSGMHGKAMAKLFFSDPWLGLAAMGMGVLAKDLQSRLSTAAVPFNRHLWGYHDYSKPGEFKKSLGMTLNNRPKPCDIFFCHPGLAPGLPTDNLREARVENFEFLNSVEFKDLLKASGTSLNRFN